MAPVTREVQSLRFGHPSEGGDPRRFLLRAGQVQYMARLRDSGQRTALIVRTDDVAAFRTFNDLVVDRRRKDPRKSLSGYLLGMGKQMVPLIEGSYTSDIQLKRSVRELLAKATGENDGRLFVVGINEGIFKRLWDAAEGLDPKKRPAGCPSACRTDASTVTETEFYEELKRRSPVAPERAARFVGTSREADRIRTLIAIASQNADPVLITGESGTGKEVVAREIHRLGERRSESFIPVNCGAIPGELFESELFGHRRGSFTGAFGDKDGLWKKADRGTLFLDEIGDLAPAHQAKILRTLEEGRIRPVGATEEIKVDARVLAATNRNLTGMVAAGEFREDLYYRLRGFTIPTSPLREHEQDIAVIAKAFWKDIAGDTAEPLSDEILAALTAHRWPGNARELKTTLRQLRVMFPGGDLEARHLQMVFLHLGQDAPGLKELPGDGGVERFRGECLQHLRRVMDVIQAVNHAVRPLEDGGRPNAKTVQAIRNAVGLHRDELERLCDKPLLFGSEPAFVAASRLKEGLAVFLALLGKDAADAKSYWKKSMSGECAAAMSAVFTAVEKVS